MPSIWDDIKKTVKESATVVKEKTEEFSRIGKLRYEIMGIDKKIEKVTMELGAKVYELISRNKATALDKNNEVRNAVKSIDELKKERVAKDKEIDKVKKEAQEGQKEKSGVQTPKKKDSSKVKSSTAKPAQSRSSQKSSSASKTSKKKTGTKKSTNRPS